jgi:gamma-glutamyl hercynylcysteine S-oxide synthase
MTATPPPCDMTFRHAAPEALAAGLASSRADTLATFAQYGAALQSTDLAVPYSEEVNPPLWELGHVGWFQDWWLRRNPQASLGLEADPEAPRLKASSPGADALYNSSHVQHATRWHLPLPSAQQTLHDLAEGLAANLHALASLPADAADARLYFYRLCLAHEDMHHEAALYTAQSLGIGITDPRWQPKPMREPGPALQLAAGPFQTGWSDERGFAFDNELGAHELSLPGCSIDRQAVRWAEFLPFVDAGGYDNPRWWPGAAGVWLSTARLRAPRYLRKTGLSWEALRQGQWQPLDLKLPACHLTAFEAQAWCAWAGRRLPTEAEWECAALQHADSFRWGDVWEWTSSAFAPYPGFEPHPYRDYSAPWFDGRPVLRGASFGTQARMRHPRYRNYFGASRNDIFAGFRSCTA